MRKSSKLAAASPLIGSDVPIFVITAVLLGGTTIGGGYGDVLKNSIWYIFNYPDKGFFKI